MLKASILTMVAVLCAARPANAGPANTLQEMFSELSDCLRAKPLLLTKGTDVTVLFTLNRRGELMGKPRMTHIQWAGDDSERAASAAAIASGFDQCVPLSISDALGGAIAGRPIAFRFQGKTPDAKS